MGSSSSLSKRIQVIILGLEQTGKSTLLKRMVDSIRSIREDFQIESTNGFNYVNLSISGNAYSIWDLGGDKVNKDFWNIFYRTLLVKLVIYVIDLTEDSNILPNLEQLIVLMNEESLKESKFYLIFNCFMKPGENFVKDNYIKRVELIITRIKEYKIYRINERFKYEIIDFHKSTFSESDVDAILSFSFKDNI